MKMMRRIPILLLVAALAGNMAACGSRSKESSAGDYYSGEGAYEADNGWGLQSEAKASTEAYDSAEEAAADASLSEADQTALGTEGAQAERKLIRNMSISLETTGFDELIAVIEQNAKTLGGYVESSSVSGTADAGRRYSYVTVRVPADQLDQFEMTLGSSATVVSKSSNVQDVTLSYSDLAAHISSLRAEQKALTDMLAAAENMEDILAIRGELTDIRYQLESYESQMKVMENQISYSTVNIDIKEVKTPTVQEKEGFFSRLKYTFITSTGELGEEIQDFLVFFLGNIFSIILFIAIAVGVLYLIRGIFRFLFGRKDREKKQRSTGRRGLFRRFRKKKEVTDETFVSSVQEKTEDPDESGEKK